MHYAAYAWLFLLLAFVTPASWLLYCAWKLHREAVRLDPFYSRAPDLEHPVFYGVDVPLGPRALRPTQALAAIRLEVEMAEEAWDEGFRAEVYKHLRQIRKLALMGEEGGL